jgi:hypothetical protein
MNEIAWISRKITYGFGFFKGKLSNHGPIFGRIVHIPISNNFCNYGFVGCHKKWIFILSMHGRFSMKWLQIKGRVQNGTTPIFQKVRDLEEWPYLHFLDIWMMFESKFLLWVFKYTSNFLGEIPASRCGTPETMHVRLECTIHLGTLRTHHRLDLYFKQEGRVQNGTTPVFKGTGP